MSFSLSTIDVDGTATAVVQVDETLYRIEDIAPSVLPPQAAAGLIDVFERWPENELVLVDAVGRLESNPGAGRLVPRPASLEKWLTPLRFPRKVICTGFNYMDHATKDGGHSSFSKDDNIPVFFLKPPTTTLVGAGASVRYPAQSAKFDYELELAVIISRRGRKIRTDEAMSYVAGYTIGLDMSARDWQRHPQHMAKFDLFGGKAFDDSCPLGPGIVPARFVNHDNLQLRLQVNGELRQDASTSDMIWTVAEQIARISEHVTLEPGDVIMTGTPAGVGLASGTWLKAGDVLEAEITGLGTLTVQIIDDGEVDGC
jgi:2-keto-4-pentenoate hydratase/2-oxohepta-3-ene-1,7-dioic acid hydratase in catechol pathway